MPLDTPVARVDVDADFWSLRFVDEASDSCCVRKNVALPFERSRDRGVMATVYAAGGYGYAATADTSPAGIAAALERARRWAVASAPRAIADSRALPRPSARDRYRSAATAAGARLALDPREWFDRLMAESNALAPDERLVDWEASVEVVKCTQRYVTSEGGDVSQEFSYLMPSASVTAHGDGDTVVRTLNGHRGICQQGGEEVLARFGFTGSMPRIAEEALELLAAPDCPTGTRDVLLAPDQMVLQIHESIGHPLELDRILGDERNFAGTSFVTPDMFGSYRYGSELLDVTFDPTRPEELASYGYDDDGTRAEKAYLIRKGVLERPLGGAISQQRAGMPGVANARASSWNRPPIDRMANLNIEPGDASFDDMVASIEDGIYLQTNCSWSIDDSRNKFQFGCERGTLIRDGRLAGVVKHPSYRGVSASFWRSLARVGDASTLEVLGTPFCGKGEPSQVIRVGHASPACVFTGVAVFGAEA